jgi:hypothetical protein
MLGATIVLLIRTSRGRHRAGLCAIRHPIGEGYALSDSRRHLLMMLLLLVTMLKMRIAVDLVIVVAAIAHQPHSCKVRSDIPYT